WEVDLEAHYGNTFNIDNAPVIGDYNGDGELDVFVVGGYGTSSTPENNHGRAYMLSAGEGSGQGWPMFRHDIRRSGCFEGSGTGIEEENQLPSLIELNCYPNPFASVTRMIFHLTVSCHVSGEVFDLAGRMVKGVIDLELQAGQHQVNLDLTNLPSGIYIVRLHVGTASSVMQIVKLD
ncbi:MAG: T9SS type A sorting domain-containing protein, partial [Candidatus Fermentibacteria bacterium]